MGHVLRANLKSDQGTGAPHVDLVTALAECDHLGSNEASRAPVRTLIPPCSQRLFSQRAPKVEEDCGSFFFFFSMLRARGEHDVGGGYVVMHDPTLVYVVHSLWEDLDINKITIQMIISGIT